MSIVKKAPSTKLTRRMEWWAENLDYHLKQKSSKLLATSVRNRLVVHYNHSFDQLKAQFR